MPLSNIFSNPQAIDRDIAVGETELFQDVEGSGPRVDYSVDRIGESPATGLADQGGPPGDGISSLVQDNYPSDAAAGLDLGQGLDPVTQGDLFASPIPLTQAEIDQNNLDSGYRVIDGRAVNLNGVPEIAREDFGEYDPFTYDWRSATDQSFRFLSPEDVGVPEGIEAVYGATERDPFRTDWADASFRIPEGYEGEMLTGDEMNAVQEAQTFISNFAVEAGEQGLSIREYLAALKFSDPQMFNAISEQLNNFGGLWDQYGGQYKFQAALHDSQQLAVDPLAPDELVKNSIDLLRDYVNAGAISQADAAVLASDPAALVQWLTGGGPSGTGIAGAGGTDANADPDKLYYDDDVDKLRPMMLDPVTNLPVPFLAANEKVVDGKVIRIENGAITVVRDEYEYSDSGSNETVQTVQPVQPVQPADGLDKDGNTLIYPTWDTEQKYPFIYNTVTGNHEAAILPGQTVDSEGRLLGENGGTIIREDFDYGFGFFDNSPGVDDAGNVVPPVSGNRTAPEREPAAVVPTTDAGLYDVQADIERAGADVLSLLYDPDSNIDVTSFIAQGGKQSPVFDPDLFKVVSESEYNDFNGPKAEGYDTTRRDNGNQWVWSYFILKNPVDALQLQYQQINLFDNKSGKAEPHSDFQMPQVNVFGPHRNVTNEPLMEQFDELVKERDYSYPARVSRMMSPEYNKGWDFNIFQSQPVQEYFLEEINNFLMQTGLSLESVAMQDHEDILYTGDAENVFDVNKFLQGYDDEDGNEVWGGALDGFRTLVNEQELGGLGSDEDLLSMHSLERLALLMSGITLPLHTMVRDEGDLRSSGSEFDDSQSISSVIMGMLEPYTPPPFLEGGFSAPIEGEETLGLDTVLGSFAGGSVPGMASGGYIGGIAGGMDDTVPATVDGSQPAALSAGEFVVPADVVSHLGDGNNQNGASKLYQFLDQVRTVKTGSVEQPAPLDDGMMSGIMGDSYGR